MSVLYLDSVAPHYWVKKKNIRKHKQFLHVFMIKNNFEYLFATSVKCSNNTISPPVHKLAKHIPFAAVAFIPLLNGKLDIKS